MFSGGWRRLHSFPRLAIPCLYRLWLCAAPFACFPALRTGYIVSRALHRLHSFPSLPLVACLPALAAGWMFSRACHWFRFSRACQRLHVFPRLTLGALFAALATDWMFPNTCHRLHGFPRLVLVIDYHCALSRGCMFLLRVLIGSLHSRRLLWLARCVYEVNAFFVSRSRIENKNVSQIIGK